MGVDRGAAQTSIGKPNPMYAGRVFLDEFGWKPENMVLVAKEDRDGEEALKVIFSHKDARGLGATQIVWILPEKNYSVLRDELYVNGKLNTISSYANHVLLDSGDWYPMAQKVEKVQADIPSEISSLLRDGTLQLWSDEVLSQQNILRQEVYEYSLELAKLNEPLDDNLFDFEFPEGTTVYDYIPQYSKEPLKRVVGEEMIIAIDDIANMDNIEPANHTNEKIVKSTESDQAALEIREPTPIQGDEKYSESKKQLTYGTSKVLLLCVIVLAGVLITGGSLIHKGKI